MQAKFLYAVLLLALVAAGKTASPVDPIGYLSWPLSADELASINFYKQYYVYVQALWQEGIPGLNVPPFDPYHTDDQFTIFQAHNPEYPTYSNMEITLNGLNVSDFSYFDINTAELDAEAMKVNLSLHENQVILTNNDVRATATNSDGQLLSCDCTYVEGGVMDTTFNSVKQLEVVGNILQVKHFNLDFISKWGYLNPVQNCTGDVELMNYMSDLLFETLADMTLDVIPEYLSEMAGNITTVLNDIFALRNITYEVDSGSPHQLRHQLSEVNGNIPHKTISRSRTRADYENSAKVLNENPITMTWNEN